MTIGRIISKLQDVRKRRGGEQRREDNSAGLWLPKYNTIIILIFIIYMSTLAMEGYCCALFFAFFQLRLKTTAEEDLLIHYS